MLLRFLYRLLLDCYSCPPYCSLCLTQAPPGNISFCYCQPSQQTLLLQHVHCCLECLETHPSQQIVIVTVTCTQLSWMFGDAPQQQGYCNMYTVVLDVWRRPPTTGLLQHVYSCLGCLETPSNNRVTATCIQLSWMFGDAPQQQGYCNMYTVVLDVWRRPLTTGLLQHVYSCLGCLEMPPQQQGYCNMYTVVLDVWRRPLTGLLRHVHSCLGCLKTPPTTGLLQHVYSCLGCLETPSNNRVTATCTQLSWMFGDAPTTTGCFRYCGVTEFSLFCKLSTGVVSESTQSWKPRSSFS